LILIVYSAIVRPTSQVIVVDEIRLALNYYTCSTGQTYFILIGVEAAFLFGFMIYGSWIGKKNLLSFISFFFSAFRIRNIPLEMYNESRVIGYALYNFFLFSLILASMFFIDDIKVELYVKSAIFLIGSTSTISGIRPQCG